MNLKIYKQLYLYNIHLGHHSNLNTVLNQYIIGKRFGFYILNLSKSFLLFKKAFYFVTNLAKEGGNMLFSYSNFLNLSLLMKCILISTIKVSNQQIVTYNWVYGSVSNYFFSFFYIIKELTSSWVMKKNFSFNYNKDTNNFNSYSLESKRYYFLRYTFLKSKYHKDYKHIKLNKFYKKWYSSWIKKQVSFRSWEKQNKKPSQYDESKFLKFFFLHDINSIWKKKNNLKFKYLFIRLFFFISKKKKDPFFWDVEKEYIFDNEDIHKRLLMFWRLIIYFKYFSNYFQVPDSLFYMFPNTNDLPLNEFSSASLPSIGVVDTNCNINRIHYPIVSNDDSLIILLFYFKTFSNIFSKCDVNLYKYMSNYTK